MLNGALPGPRALPTPSLGGDRLIFELRILKTIGNENTYKKTLPKGNILQRFGVIQLSTNQNTGWGVQFMLNVDCIRAPPKRGRYWEIQKISCDPGNLKGGGKS